MIGLKETGKNRVCFLLWWLLPVLNSLIAENSLLIGFIHHSDEVHLFRVEFFHYSVYNAPFGETLKLGFSQVKQETVSLDKDNSIELGFLLVEGSNSIFNSSLNFLKLELQLILFQVVVEFVILLLNIINKMLWQGEHSAIVFRVRSHWNSINLLHNMVVNINQVTRRLVG